MAEISSNNSGQRARCDMRGKVNDYLGVTFAHIDGKPTLQLRMTDDAGRHWCLRLDADETAKVFAGSDQVRALKTAA